MGIRFSPGCCCEDIPALSPVLYWGKFGETLGDPTVGIHITIQICLNDISVEMDVMDDVFGGPNEYSGDIHQYSLVFVRFPTTDPPWLSEMLSSGWTGRVVLMGEHTGFAAANNYINTLTPVTGLSMTTGDFDIDPNPGGTVEVGPPLNAGVARHLHQQSSAVNGGTVLSQTVIDGPFPWLAHNKVGTIDWVVAGDTAPFRDTNATLGRRFVQNCFTVPV